VLVIEFFHSKGIIYRGIHPQQILLDTSGHILVLQKLELVEDKGSRLEDLSTCEYIGAPEILEGREDTPAVDWWSLGILIYQFFTGQTPFAGPQLNAVIEKIIIGNLTFPKDVHSSVKSLISMLLDKDEVSRLNAAKNIKSHPFFANINWQLLAEKKLEPPYRPAEDKLYRVVFPDAEMSDTVVMPNFTDHFRGFTFATPTSHDK